ncbi:putative baseplate assembly protein [Chloroflexales bacterium ZM16-3]|nr:putative baseplate assembly protein [Chloroflexales bacterium ZM16-3]
MPPVTPALDERTAQDLVDWAKTELIPRYCPEWTDHNVSDPGVALIEIFAAMTETLLFRVNRIPDRLQNRLLELIGVKRSGPKAAEAEITFYLSAPQPAEVEVKPGTEIATRRKAESPEVVFSTSKLLIIRPAQIKAFLTENASAIGRTDHMTRHVLNSQQRLSLPIALFPDDKKQRSNRRPDNGDAFYIGFAQDPSSQLVQLTFTVVDAKPVGLQPDRPPLRWEAQCLLGDSMLGWQRVPPEHDVANGFTNTTRGFSETGNIAFHLPEAMVETTHGGVSGYWLRCVINGQQQPTNWYQESPTAVDITAETWGGTVDASHARLVRDEELGRSDGTPGQTFRLRYAPVLDPTADEQLVVRFEGREELWTKCNDFGGSSGQSRHYTLDPIDGTVRLGPALVQPDGALHSFGMVPPLGSRLRFSHYRHGGGRDGNLAANELIVLKSAPSYIKSARNRARTHGGADAQSIEDVATRAPETLRTRDRAVTAADFVTLAQQVRDVSRAYAYTPGRQGTGATPGMPRPTPGEVVLVVLPNVEAEDGQIPIDKIETLASQLEVDLEKKIAPCVMLGTSVRFRAPEIYPVQIVLDLRVPRGTPAPIQRMIEQTVAQELYRYLNPYTGGPGGAGWPFGRTLRVNEIYGRIQPLLGSAYVPAQALKATLRRGGRSQEIIAEIASFPVYGIICSDVHMVRVQEDPT